MSSRFFSPQSEQVDDLAAVRTASEAKGCNRD